MITPSTHHPCPTVAKELARIEADYSRQKSAILNAAGLIAEAEALYEALKERLPNGLFATTVHSYGREHAQAHLYVWRDHLAFFEALATMGIACRESTPISFDDRGKSSRTLTLDGFDVEVLAEAEIILPQTQGKWQFEAVELQLLTEADAAALNQFLGAREH